MKKYIRNNKGITITTLVVTVIILLILTSTVVIKVSDSKDVSKLNNLYSDIKILEEKILNYYNNYGTLPIKGETIAPLLSMEEGNNYYEIDLSKLENITLKYGHGNITNKDIYIVNGDTLDVYYYKGIEYKGEKYYTYEYKKDLWLNEIIPRKK